MSARIADSGRRRVRACSILVLAGCTFNSGGLGGGSASGPGSAGPTTTEATTSTTSSSSSSTDGESATGSTGDTATMATDSSVGSEGDTSTTVSDPSAGESTSTTTDAPSPCDVDNGGCDADATCQADQNQVECVCNDGFVGDGLACATAPSFDTLRVNLGCNAHDQCGGPPTCTTDANAAGDAAFGGDDGVDYEVTLRIRGVVEVTTYANGTCDGMWCEGGTGVGAPWNEITLTTESPLVDYRLNNGEAGTLELFAIDEEHTIVIPGGTTVTLRMDGNGTCSVANDGDLVVPDIPPAPQAFDGQFVQIDLVSAAIAR